MPDAPNEFSRNVENLIAELRGVPRDTSRSRKRREHPLGESIDKLLRKYHIGVDAPDHTIREHWAEIVGAANAAYSHPVKIGQDGRLLVLTSHAVVRDELRLLEPVLLQRVRQLHSCEHVCGLIVRAG
jgi:predicted nucleic acid-binding Zn ribbon protein